VEKRSSFLEVIAVQLFAGESSEGPSNGSV